MHRVLNAERVPSIQQSVAKRRLALLLASALALTVAPVSVPDIGLASAWAKGGNGGGNGGGGGGGNGGGGGGNGGGNAGGGRSGDNGKGFGGGGFGNARAGGQETRGVGKAGDRGRPADVGGGLGRPGYTLDDTLTANLVARGWQDAAPADATGFRNHGHRVSSMVEIAKALGYGAHVGALQANFGGPYGSTATTDTDAARETLTAEMAGLRDDLAALEDPESDDARAIEARLAEIEGELAALDAPTDEPAAWDGDWRTANLDITGDGVVDLADLEAARQLGATTPGEPAAEDEPTEQAAEPDQAPEETADVADTALMEVQ